MATVGQGLQVKTRAVQAASEQKNLSLKAMMGQDKVKDRFAELLGKKAPGFLSSLLAVANDNKLLAKASPETILAAGAMAASLDLPINKNLGFAYIVPYKSEAQFQLGYKGYIQLAMRTGQYQTINAAEVYEGEITKQNRFTGEYEFGEKTSDTVVGYIAYFKLVNGFEKYLYMSIEDMKKHASKYSKNYSGGTDRWGLTDFHSMATKTVLKRLLSKYGILSIEMQSASMINALANDGGVLRQDEEGNFTADFDGETIETDGMIVNSDTGEIVDIEPIAAAPGEGGQETLL